MEFEYNRNIPKPIEYFKHDLAIAALRLNLWNLQPQATCLDDEPALSILLLDAVHSLPFLQIYVRLGRQC
jgi:hypothetical protein